MTRTKPAEQRRADLLAAGEELFLAKGVAATSLDDITSRAGVSKGLFYLYFRSKDELLAAMQDQFSVKLAERIRTATELAGDWPGKLDACVQTIFDSYQERHDLHEVLFQHAGHVSASHRATHAFVLGAISDLLVDGKAAGVFDVEDPKAAAVLCWASTHGFDPGFQGEPEGEPMDGDRLVSAAKQLFRRAAGLTAGPKALTLAESAGTVRDNDFDRRSLVLTEQDAQPGQRARALRLHHSRRQVQQLRHRLDAVILPVAQDDDGAVPRAELPQSVQQRCRPSISGRSRALYLYRRVAGGSG